MPPGGIYGSIIRQNRKGQTTRVSVGCLLTYWGIGVFQTLTGRGGSPGAPGMAESAGLTCLVSGIRICHPQGFAPFDFAQDKL